MNIAIPTDSDEAVRIVAFQGAQWFYEITETQPTSIENVMALAAQIEHALTNGQTIAFDCRDKDRKFIR